MNTYSFKISLLFKIEFHINYLIFTNEKILKSNNSITPLKYLVDKQLNQFYIMMITTP